jgi:hypothetical protein
MTSSNVIADPAPVVGSPAEKTTEAVDAASPMPTSPFELLPAGEAFGVCDLDGACS